MVDLEAKGGSDSTFFKDERKEKAVSHKLELIAC
jgi:hypothetical protein